MLENLKEFTNRLPSSDPPASKSKQIRTKLYKKAQVPKIADREILTHKTFGAALWQREEKSKEVYQPRTWDSLAHSKESKQEEERNRSLFSRPEQLLKKYLHRKEKLSGLPVFNPEHSEVSTPQEYKTLTDFRIKKPKKGMSVVPLPANQLESDCSVQYEPSREPEGESFMEFNTTKNLYKMTYQELEASIRWKKQFLDVLNKKIRDSRTSQMRNRLY